MCKIVSATAKGWCASTTRVVASLVRARAAQGDEDTHDGYFDVLLRLSQEPLSNHAKRVVDATLVAGQTQLEEAEVD